MFYVSIIGIILFIVAAFNLFPMFLMHPLPSGKIEGTDITAIKTRMNNLFFIASGEDWIVIDAGCDARLVKREMQERSMDARKVKGVFLTHTDYDHVASVPLFPNAEIYLSEWERQMIDGSTNRQFLKKNSLPKRNSSNKITYLSDHDVVNLCGHQIRVIEAPGHTKGSAMYALDDTYLFTGDAFKLSRGTIQVHPYTMERKKAQATINRIKDDLKKYAKVFTAHYGILK